MASQAGRSEHKSQMSDTRREKLLDIQKREQLKGMLTNKFKLKYGSNTNVAAYIDNEVGKFLKNDRLTEENLKKLDNKIMREAELRDKKDAVLSDHKSQKGSTGPKSRASRPGTGAVGGRINNDDAVSVASSKMSGASRLSRKSNVS